jgi:hypothetical protein
VTTLVQLARRLGITQQAVYVAAGLLIQRSTYWQVIEDPETGELTAEAEQAIVRYAAARINEFTLEEPLRPSYAEDC